MCVVCITCAESATLYTPEDFAHQPDVVEEMPQTEIATVEAIPLVMESSSVEQGIVAAICPASVCLFALHLS